MSESTPLVQNPPRFFGEDLLSQGIRQKLRDLIEQILGAELEATLQAARYTRAEGARLGYRHGTKPRTLLTGFGPVELSVPRARLSAPGGTAEWQSRILPRYERRTRELDETLVGVYLAGANLRRIKIALSPLVDGAPLSRSVVSRLVGHLKGHLEAWAKRRLEAETYVYLYLDATILRIKVLGSVRKVPVLVALGVRLDGFKEVLAMEPLIRESEASWAEVLEGMVRRGLNRPALAVIDGNAGLRNAVQTTWPGLPIQRCVVHKLRNIENHCPQPVYDEVKRDFHQIVAADSLDRAREAYRKFVEAWKARVPKVVSSLEEAGEELLTFYAFPQRQWKCLRTTNPVERLNEEFRRRVKTQCSFPSPDSALVLLFGMVAVGQIRFRRIDGWDCLAEVTLEHAEELRRCAS